VARTGQEIANPVTGEHVTFLQTASDTQGELLEMDLRWTRQGFRAAEHVHPEMEERYEVRSGTAAFRIGGVERVAGAGEVVVVPRNTPHIAWNPAEVEARLRVQFRPALRWEEFVERLFALAAEGRTDPSGMPERPLMRALLREFKREIAPVPPA
jgi:mannose-6-phosphate isomerase-like protein (cupin superfamily)